MTRLPPDWSVWGVTVAAYQPDTEARPVMLRVGVSHLLLTRDEARQTAVMLHAACNWTPGAV